MVAINAFPTDSDEEVNFVKDECDKLGVQAILAHGFAKGGEGMTDLAEAVVKEIIASDWEHPYSKVLAAYPIEGLENNKCWPTVGRIDGAYGDRNLVCSCNPITDYA